MQQGRVDLAIDLEPVVVAEVGRRTAHQIPLARRSVSILVVLTNDQADGRQSHEYCPQPIWSNFSLVYQHLERLLRTGKVPEEIEIERGEQGLRAYEAVGNARDLADVGNRRWH